MRGFSYTTDCSLARSRECALHLVSASGLLQKRHWVLCRSHKKASGLKNPAFQAVVVSWTPVDIMGSGHHTLGCSKSYCTVKCRLLASISLNVDPSGSRLEFVLVLESVVGWKLDTLFTSARRNVRAVHVGTEISQSQMNRTTNDRVASGLVICSKGDRGHETDAFLSAIVHLIASSAENLNCSALGLDELLSQWLGMIQRPS